MFMVINYLQIQFSIFQQDLPRQEFRFFIRIGSKVAKKAATIQKNWHPGLRRKDVVEHSHRHRPVHLRHLLYDSLPRQEKIENLQPKVSLKEGL